MANWPLEAVTRLGAATKARRAHLGLTQIQVWERGGPSNSTQTAIEAAGQLSISTVTLRKLDIALDWASGTALSILTEGSQPANLQSVPIDDLLAEVRRRMTSVGDAEPTLKERSPDHIDEDPTGGLGAVGRG